jgi:hypothetical protein
MSQPLGGGQFQIGKFCDWPGEYLSMHLVFSALILLAMAVTLYGLHRLGLYLERRNLIFYWYKKPNGGSAYSPLHEMVQPQARHVIEIGEQRVLDNEQGGPGDLNSAIGS